MATNYRKDDAEDPARQTSPNRGTGGEEIQNPKRDDVDDRDAAAEDDDVDLDEDEEFEEDEDADEEEETEEKDVE